jgi:predicted O-methyltransferase YrrM
MSMIFSIPINPKLTEQQFAEFYQFCSDHREVIYDLYFTCRMPPFVQDAMGDVIIGNHLAPIEAALYIQDTLGIPISATFNNILVRPSQQNLDLFIQNFKQLYDLGIHSATIPHTHWMATGQIQKAFPKLNVKNTILRNVTQPSEVAKLAEAGFHYVNLERDLMRDHDKLKVMRKVANKYGIKLSLLGNEGCLGGCPMMDEHFHFNNSRQGSTPQYFNDAISRVSCPKWDKEEPAIHLKTANFPPWKEDWDELLQYVDVFKMHGRESIDRLYDTMKIVERYHAGEEILFDTFNAYIEENNLVDKPINAWRKIIKTCKFDCWDCNYCDKVYEAKSSIKEHPLVRAVTTELVNSVNYDNQYDVMGLTAPRVQKLLYGLSTHCKKYLEIGSALGSTAVAVVDNPNIDVTCIDNWSQNIQPESDEFALPDNLMESFLKNIKRPVTVINSDLFKVDTSTIKDIDLFFYDGPHEEELTKRAVEHYKDCYADTCIMIFDDANWEGVVAGAGRAIDGLGYKVLYHKKMLNNAEDRTQWWNGLFIVVIQRETV